MQKYKTFAFIASVVIALLVPLLIAVQANRNMASYPVVKFEIEPYDPRDLLYGHYMTFAFKWNWKGGSPDKTACSGENCCLCVGEGDLPEVSLSACPADNAAPLPSCRHMVKGRYSGGEFFDVGINRYYVDESIALPLEKLFRDKKEKFSLALGLKPNAKPVVGTLYVGDQTLKDYLSTHDGRVPEEQPIIQP